MKQIFGVIVCVALFAGLPAFADFQKGFDAWSNGNYETAVRELKPLAKQGSGSAQLLLGLMYYNGQGTPQDYSEAAKWWRLSAEQGVGAAQSHLGLMYKNGHGVPQDYNEAIKWYRLSAEIGYAPAQFNLGVSYYRGQGVSQNYVLAHMWFNLAASKGHENAVESRDRVAKQMSPEQISEAQKKATACKAKDYKGC